MNRGPAGGKDRRPVHRCRANAGQCIAEAVDMDHGETVLKEFQDRGGVVTTLSGAEKAKFDKLMKEKVMPAMAKMIDSDALLAAQEYAKNN